MLSLAFSPCPNDTFIFAALVHGWIDREGLTFDYQMADVEELNLMALSGNADMIKVSFHAWLSIREHYELLESGSALGFGNGPLVVAKSRIPSFRFPGNGEGSQGQISDIRVALPGEHTTAHLLFNLAYPQVTKKEFMLFSDIERAVLSGEVDAGVIIHESRFTYQQKGLVKLMDLGEFWEEKSASPIPLGGIIAKRHLGEETLDRLNRIMRRSVQFAIKNPDGVMNFVREHAQEMDDSVIRKHIDLYVNRFTLDLGEDGSRAIQTLIDIYD
ncbi:MAG: 1,4-dihydroxy-6-naphthoate synthase [Bacteroidales bacterium]|nr:1,4-dihydroxy-6-naphthoate synthase [Bacteroidales bacterium]